MNDTKNAEPVVDDELPPGSHHAREMGCRCSVLANTGRPSPSRPPLVDPTCPLHAMP